jgi:carbonic anhydrase/acetyltransferase-like protein (isoleucine patch superfamily)
LKIAHKSKYPIISDKAYIAPNAVVSGEVIIDEDVRILYGAVITAEGSPVHIKMGSIIMENTVLRSVGANPLVIGEHVLIGPHVYLTGCTIHDHSFLGAGAKVYNGAIIGEGSIIAIGGIVHVDCHLPEHTRIPIYNIAIGSPAKVFSPDQVHEIGNELKEMDFLRSVFGALDHTDLTARLKEAHPKYGTALASHQNDNVVEM